jgi:formate dehydrogenase iron-sulfur subunit
VNGLPPDVGEIDGVRAFDMPSKLTADNLMVIQAYRDGTTGQSSFIKKNCMHCNIPACASACPVAALEKTEAGPVVYHEDRCIGCRYCLLACPYEVPRYEWLDRKPRVRKCSLKMDCVHACPVGALKAGTRGQLIEEAHDRIHENPGRYIDHVYGEHEAGGASYLILTHVPLEKLGLPKLSSTVRSSYADALMGSLPGLIIGLGLFLGGLHQLEKRQRQIEAESPDRTEQKGQQ